MIAISLNGTFLDLGDASIRWEHVNTLFEDNALQADYSFPFTFPLSDPNIKALGYINKAEVPKTTVRFPVTLFLGTKSISSVLIVNGAKKSGFNASIAGGFLGLVNADKKLSELNYNGGAAIYIPDLSDLSAYKTIDWKNIIAFPPHYNPDFYGDNNPDFNGVVNRQNATTGAYLLNDITVFNKYALVPWMYLFYVLKTIFDENGLTPTGTFWSNAEMSTALLYNNYAIDAPQGIGATVFVGTDYLVLRRSPYTNYPIKFLNSVAGAIDDDSNWDNTDFFYLVPTTADYICEIDLYIKTDAVPTNYVWVGITVNTTVSADIVYNGVHDAKIYHISGSFGVSANAGDKIYGNNFFLYNDDLNYTILKESSLKVSRSDAFELNSMNNNITLSNHVPDMTISDLLKEIKNLPQVTMDIDWDNKLAILNLADDVISGPHEKDLTNLADPYPEQVFDSRGNGFVLRYDFGTQDALINTCIPSYSFANKSIELATSIPKVDTSKIIGEIDSPAGLVTPAQLGDFVVVKGKNHIFQAQFISGTKRWAYYADNYLPVFVNGLAPVDRAIRFAPLLMTQNATNEDGGGVDVVALMPTIREQGSSPMFNQGINPPSLRMAFMRGENIDHGFGGRYIYASPSNYDLNGNNVGNYNMKFYGADNWYNLFLEKILLAIDGSEIFEYLIMLPISYLKYRGKVQIKNVNFLIKNISMIIGKTVKQSVVKLLKL